MAHKRPRILSAFLSHLPDEDRVKLQQEQPLPTNHNPQLSLEEFMEKNIQDLGSRLNYVKEYWKALQASCRQSLIIKDKKVEEELRELEDIRLELEIETYTVKRQKRLILDDMKDGYPSTWKIEDAYIAAIRTKTMAATINKRRFRQTEFKKVVADYLQAQRQTEGLKYMWCHILGDWLEARLVKTAHIVPKSLDPDAIGYVFGAFSMTLDDERNGITLHHSIEEAFDRGTIVIVPVAEGQIKRWKCVLMDQTKQKLMVMPGVKWQVGPRQGLFSSLYPLLYQP
ncbi:predicted protein [Uncinocarpus reesii 1704]|uniref:HNH nuclease domain-containing protein n=1 Tax=Uncinocarpus reesii (strain UAMH 1704) TaxID=336963 RepID=C4JQB0_UNCRE|nr:uncharacterized protein UREG_04664 [Uncinocarpus reesii 1704]EEP79818.1 predicted protein [Uncinocarpus reesii 1704]